jgi:hypothetical protein
MAILGPEDLPAVLQIDSRPIKDYVLASLGNPVVEVEILEQQFEIILRTAGDFIAHYLPKEEKYAYFYTTPLQSEYETPRDAYWIEECNWDPATTNIGDIFGAESFLFNIGNVTGIQNVLLDYTLLMQYRRFSQRILGTEGHWECLGSRKIRLFPTPKGAFPVVVKYIPKISSFRSPISRRLVMDMILAESMIMLGMARGKFSGLPSPDGGSLTMNGADLITRGNEMRDKIIDQANSLADPLGPLRY